MKSLARKIRIHVLKMITSSKSSHIGSSYSIVEILVTLYFKILKVDSEIPQYEQRDKFILSKGHGSPAFYATLVEKGFFPVSYLEKFYIDGGILPGHLFMVAPGIENSAGSLGHGLSLGIGMAIANRQSGNSGKIFVLIGDGECNEGSIWEGIMLASHLKLTNLTVIVDYNKIQSFGRTNDVINQEPIVTRWKSFGWDVFDINGHNFEELIESFIAPQNNPKVIIANTVKGKGVSFMEDNLDWHYKSPDNEQYEQALLELENS